MRKKVVAGFESAREEKVSTGWQEVAVIIQNGLLNFLNGSYRT